LLQQAEWSARFGLLPVFNKFHQDIGPTRQLPENARAMDVRPVTFRAGRDDLISIARLVPPSQRKAGGFGGSLGEIPMIVISHGLVSPGAPKGMQAAFLESSERLTALSSNSLHIVAKNSRHYIYMSEPELVVDAIRRVHAAARGGTRLNGPVPRASK
jgi:hypothetical protein